MGSRYPIWAGVLVNLPPDAQKFSVDHDSYDERHWCAKIEIVEKGKLDRTFLQKSPGPSVSYVVRGALKIGDVIEIGNKKIKLGVEGYEDDKIVRTNNHYYLVVGIYNDEIELEEHRTSIQAMKAREEFLNQLNPDLVLQQKLTEFSTEELRAEIERRESAQAEVVAR